VIAGGLPHNDHQQHNKEKNHCHDGFGGAWHRAAHAFRCLRQPRAKSFNHLLPDDRGHKGNDASENANERDDKVRVQPDPRRTKRCLPIRKGYAELPARTQNDRASWLASIRFGIGSNSASVYLCVGKPAHKAEWSKMKAAG